MKENYLYFDKQPAHRTIGMTEKTGFIEKTIEPWLCRWRYENHTRILSIISGIVWNGASAPRAVWTIIGITPGGLVDGPSLGHDLLYESKGGSDLEKMRGCTLTNAEGLNVAIDRKEADWFFLHSCIFAGLHPLRAGIAYNMLRVFGGRHWGGPSPILKG